MEAAGSLSIRSTAKINADGGDGGDGATGSYQAGGGGIFLEGFTVESSGSVHADLGMHGVSPGSGSYYNRGGAGGDGRIRIVELGP